MLKRLLLILILAPLPGLGFLWLSEDVAPWRLNSAAGLATGLGAKLACSGKHLSGFSTYTIEDDLASYSGMTRFLRFRDLSANAVEASMMGVSSQARYRPGLGCTLEYGPNGLDAVKVPAVVPDPEQPWPRGSVLAAPRPQLQVLLDSMLKDDNAAGYKTRALLVVQDGQLLAEAYALGLGPETPLLGWSMGKSVTAIMLGRLEMMGLADAHETALLSAWAGDGRAEISLENLLQMTSGLAFEEDYVPGSDSTRMLFMSPKVAQLAIRQPLKKSPGSFFYYSSGTTNILSKLVYERVGDSAQAMANFFYKEIAQPLALAHTVLEPDTTGVVVGSSFVYASARDWARFGQLMVGGGEINGRRLLSADWVARAARPNTSDNDGRYGYQFWLNDGGEPMWWPSLPRTAYAMQGNRKQVVMILPQQRAVIVRLGWSNGDYPTDENFARIVAELEP